MPPEVNQSSPMRGALGKKKRVAQLVSDSETLDAAYSRLFKTKDGQIVLKDLRKRFYDHEIDGTDMCRDVGRRDVLHFINRRVTPK